ncbi:MAG: hypothetical protein MUP82_06890 [Candidatus Marinimicrobia bacterium]|nr:hypothetical protein [Candidatus Neomarinimicrobiota bacterium]
MALASITNPATNIDYREPIRIDKYDFENYDSLKSKIDEIYEESNSLVSKYYSSKEKEMIITLTEYSPISLDTIRNDCRLIARLPQLINPASPEPPDNNDRNKKMTELQQNLLKSLASEKYVKAKQKKADLERNRQMRIIARIERYKKKQLLIEGAKIGYVEYSCKLLSILGVYVVPTGVMIFVNYLIVTNPITWLPYILPLLGQDKLYFYAFLDFMTNLGIFDLNEKLALRTLYSNMMTDIATNPTKINLTNIKQIINVAFGLDKNGKRGDAATLMANFGSENPEFKNISLEADTRYLFYSNISKMISNKDPTLIKFEGPQMWNYLISLYNSNAGKVALSYLRIASPIFGYINTSWDILRQYENVNSSIFLKGIVEPALKNESFMYYNQYVSSSVVDKASQLLQFVQGSNAGKAEFFFTNDFWKNIIVGQLQSQISMKLNMSSQTFFENIENDMKKKTKIKSEEDIVYSIEQEITKRAEYKGKGFSNEEIAEMLDPSPESQYKTFIGKYMEKFFRKFKRFLSTPSTYLLALGIVFGLWIALQTIIYPLLLIAANEAVSKFVFNGPAYLNLTEFYGLSNFLDPIHLMNILVFFIKAFFGSNGGFKLYIDRYKFLLASNIIHDLQVLFTSLKNVFFDSKAGMSINKYIKKITKTTLGKFFEISIDIVFKVVSNISSTQATIALAGNIPLNEKILDVISNETTMKRFAAFLNQKASNKCMDIKHTLFPSQTNDPSTSNAMENLYNLIMGTKFMNELSQLCNINYILFDNLIPYLGTDGYYSTRELNTDTLAGSLITMTEASVITSMLDNKVNYIVVDSTTNSETGTDFMLFDIDKFVQSLPGDVFKDKKRNKVDIFYDYYYSKFRSTKQKKYDSSTFIDYLTQEYNNIDNITQDDKDYTWIDKNYPWTNRIEQGLINSVLLRSKERGTKLFEPDGGVMDYDQRRAINTALKKALDDALDKEIDSKSAYFVNKNESDLFEYANLNIVFPTFDNLSGKHGFFIDVVPYKDFTDIRKILKMMSSPNGLTEQLQGLEKKADKNLNLKYDLTQLNRKYSQVFLDIAKNMNKQTDKIINYFGNRDPAKRTILDLKYIGFDYNIFHDLAAEYLLEHDITLSNVDVLKIVSQVYSDKCVDGNKKVVSYIRKGDQANSGCDSNNMKPIDEKDAKILFLRPDTIETLYDRLLTDTNLKTVTPYLKILHENVVPLVIKTISKQSIAEQNEPGSNSNLACLQSLSNTLSRLLVRSDMPSLRSKQIKDALSFYFQGHSELKLDVDGLIKLNLEEYKKAEDEAAEGNKDTFYKLIVQEGFIDNTFAFVPLSEVTPPGMTSGMIIEHNLADDVTKIHSGPLEVAYKNMMKFRGEIAKIECITKKDCSLDDITEIIAKIPAYYEAQKVFGLMYKTYFNFKKYETFDKKLEAATQLIQGASNRFAQELAILNTKYNSASTMLPNSPSPSGASAPQTQPPSGAQTTQSQPPSGAQIQQSAPINPNQFPPVNRERLEPVNKEEIKEKEQEKEEEEEKLGEETDEKIDEKLEEKFAFDWSAAGDFFSGMINMFSNLSKTDIMTAPELNTSLGSDDPEIEDVSKTPEALCRELKNSWVSQRNKLVSSPADKYSQCIRCRKENMIYSLCTRFVKTLTKGVDILSKIVSGGLWFIDMSGFSKFIVQLIKECGSTFMNNLYYTALAKTKLEDKSTEGTLGYRILQVVFMYASNIVEDTPQSNKNIIEKLKDATVGAACRLLGENFKQEKAAEEYNNLLSGIQKELTNIAPTPLEIDVIKNDTNINGYINKGGDELDYVAAAAGLATDLDANQEKIDKLLTMNPEDKCDFSGFEMKDAVIATIQDVPGRQRNYLLSYIMCELYGYPAYDKISVFELVTYTLLAPTKIPHFLEEIMAICCYNKTARNYMLTMLFGNSSNATNVLIDKNIGRDYINRGFDNLIANAKKESGNETLTYETYRKHFKKEISFLWDFLEAVWESIKELYTKSSQPQKVITYDDLPAYATFLDTFPPLYEVDDQSDNTAKDIILEGITYLNKEEQVKINEKSIIDMLIPTTGDLNYETLKDTIQDAINNIRTTPTDLKYKNTENDLTGGQILHFLNQLKLMVESKIRISGSENKNKVKELVIDKLINTKNPQTVYQLNDYHNFIKEGKLSQDYKPSEMLIAPCPSGSVLIAYDPKPICVEVDTTFFDSFNQFSTEIKKNIEESIAIQNARGTKDNFIKRLQTLGQNVFPNIVTKYQGTDAEKPIKDVMYKFIYDTQALIKPTTKDEDKPIPKEEAKTLLGQIHTCIKNLQESYIDIVKDGEDKDIQGVFDALMKDSDSNTDNNVDEFWFALQSRELGIYNITTEDEFQSMKQQIITINTNKAAENKQSLTNDDLKLLAKYYLLLYETKQGQLMAQYINNTYETTGIPVLDNNLQNNPEFKKILHKYTGFYLSRLIDEYRQQFVYDKSVGLYSNNGTKGTVLTYPNEASSLFYNSNLSQTETLNKIGYEDIITEIYSKLRDKHGFYLAKQNDQKVISLGKVTNYQIEPAVTQYEHAEMAEEGVFVQDEDYFGRAKLTKAASKIEPANYFLNSVLGSVKNVGPPILYNYPRPDINNINIEGLLEKLKDYEKPSWWTFFSKEDPNLVQLKADLEALIVYNNYDFTVTTSKSNEFETSIGVFKPDVAMYTHTYSDFNINTFGASVNQKLLDSLANHLLLDKMKHLSSSFGDFGFTFDYFQNLSINLNDAVLKGEYGDLSSDTKNQFHPDSVLSSKHRNFAFTRIKNKENEVIFQIRDNEKLSWEGVEPKIRVKN